MATLNFQQLLDSVAGNIGNSAQGFQMADTALDRSQILAETPEQLRRMERNFSQYSLPDLASNQAARGTFFSTGTQKKASRLGTQFTEQSGDVERDKAYKLARLGLRDIGSSIPGVSF